MKKYKLRKYAITFRCKSLGITLTDFILAETKAQAYLFLQDICAPLITWEYKFWGFSNPNGVFPSSNGDRWELVSLKWVRPIRPFDLSINKQ